MGIIIQARANKPEPRKKLFGLLWDGTAKNLSQKIIECSKIWADCHGIGDLFVVLRSDQTNAILSYYPLAEPLVFEIDDKGISLDVKTSTAGAGFHAAVIDLLDSLQKQLNIVWEWGGAVNECSDETGYALHRDFNTLQQAHRDQTINVLKYVLETDEFQGVMVYLPIQLAHSHDKIAFPRGYISESEINFDNNVELNQLVEKILLWNNREIDSTFWVNTLEGLLWQVAKWREPVDETEQKDVDVIQRVFASIPSEDIPGSLMHAYTNFQNTIKGDISGRQSKIGFYKKWLRRYQSAKWHVNVPGNWLEVETEDSVYFEEPALGQEAIVIRDMTFSHPDNKTIFPWPEFLQNTPDKLGDGFVYRIESKASKVPDTAAYTAACWIHRFSPKQEFNLLVLQVSALGQKKVMEVLNGMVTNDVRVVNED